MKYKVEIMPSVHIKLKSILQEIITYSSSQEYAIRWKEKFKKAFISLDEFPYRYPLINEKLWRSRGVHKMPIKPYIAYYCVNEEKKIVSVNALSHSKQNQDDVLEKAYGV